MRASPLDRSIIILSRSVFSSELEGALGVRFMGPNMFQYNLMANTI